tara:strand:- start:1141 stop:2601 length:1461 start_codon:yes stop_codon:yes gene_type:complete
MVEASIRKFPEKIIFKSDAENDDEDDAENDAQNNLKELSSNFIAKCSKVDHNFNNIKTNMNLPNLFLKKCPAIPCIAEFDVNSKSWNVRWTLVEAENGYNKVENFEHVTVIKNMDEFNIRIEKISTIDVASSTSSALGLLADKNMLHHITSIPKLFDYSSSFSRLAPPINTELYTESASQELAIRTGDGAYFDKSSLASIIAAGCRTGNVLIVKSTKSKYQKNPNKYPPCSAYLGKMADIKEEFILPSKKGRIISTKLEDEINGINLNLYVIEVFSRKHKHIDTMPTNFNPKFWKKYTKSADMLVKQFSTFIDPNDSSKYLWQSITGICISSGGMKTAIIGKRILHDLEVKRGSLPNLKYLSGCSGGLWSIILYFSEKTGRMEEVASIHARLVLMESECNDFSLGGLSHYGYYLHRYARLLNWIKNSDYYWTKLVSVIIDEDYLDDNEDEESMKTTEKRLQNVMMKASELGIKIVSPFVLLCNSYT